MTRAERKAANRAAHALRRAATNADYREAKAAGLALSWREVSDMYSAIPTETMLSQYADLETPAPVVETPKARREAPPHIAALSNEYRLARETWESGLSDAMAGGRRDGKPARGEKYTDEERDYRAAHPAPVWKDFLSGQSRQVVPA